MSDNPIVIVGAKRTPIGSFQGQFSGVKSPDLGAAAIKGALEQSGISAEDVNEVLMGCVLPAGVGQAPARQAALGAGLPMGVGCTTVNKVCGSAMKTVMLAHDLLRAGSAEVVVAGGMESMTEAPYMLPKARGGYRMGHGQILDHMFFDGLQNPYDDNLMGVFAEQCVDKYSFTREEQDEFAAESIRRAMAAMEDGTFAKEIVPFTVKTRKGEVEVTADEEPPTCDIERIPSLRPAFRREGGSVTAANASKISDGAAALVLTTEREAERRGLKPLAYIVGHSTHAQAPEWFTTAPVGALTKLMAHIGWNNDDVDLYEINEAFACVTMAAMREHDIPHDRVNVNGGACALGHPIGATGARILVTLLNALETRGKKHGIASLCIGGGEATAMAVELIGS